MVPTGNVTIIREGTISNITEDFVMALEEPEGHVGIGDDGFEVEVASGLDLVAWDGGEVLLVWPATEWGK